MRTDITRASTGQTADELIAEARRLSGQPAPRLRPPPGRTGLSAEVVAAVQAPRLGRKYGHDPFVAARALGFTVERVPLASLQNPRRPNVTITGRLLPGKVIQIADTIRGREAHQTVAHELAHGILGDAADEQDCQNFVRFFSHVASAELPGAGRRKFEAEALAKARAAAKPRSLLARRDM